MKLLLHLTRKERYDKYDLNQSKAEPWMPNQDDRRVSSMLWSIVSKAAERSRRQRQDTFCERKRVRPAHFSDASAAYGLLVLLVTIVNHFSE